MSSYKKQGIVALSPMMFFVVVYLGASILFHDFYSFPLTIAFISSIIFAFVVYRKNTFKLLLDQFFEGCGEKNIMLMVWIFILAGAFAGSAKDMGCVDATVDLCLRLLPSQMIIPGLFIASCFISISIGTSVGTIVAVMPIAAGLAKTCGFDPYMTAAVIVGGAFFGDNLSFISDTTIVATTKMRCKMNDKFKVNSFIVFPAVIIVLAIYIFIGLHASSVDIDKEIQPIKVIPYLVVIIAAACGMNVFKVLIVGILLTGIIGVSSGAVTFNNWLQSLDAGIISMAQLILISMMAGGLLSLVQKNGGITFLIEILTKHISGKKGAYYVIALLICLVNLCTANNTVAILSVGDISWDISQRFSLDNRKCASILDTMSCFTQGLIPYGAQILAAAGLAGLNPIGIVPYLYYPFAIGIVCVLSIFFRYPKRYS